MTDRKNVLFWLRTALDDGDCLVELPYSIATSIYNMLKEQPKIIRCKDCKHYNRECCSDGYGWCHRRDFGTNDEWYCADGEVEAHAAD